MYHYSKSKNETTVTVTVNNRNKYAHKPPPPPFLGVVPCQLPTKLKAEPWPLSPPLSDYLHCNSYQAVLSLLTNASMASEVSRTEMYPSMFPGCCWETALLSVCWIWECMQGRVVWKPLSACAWRGGLLMVWFRYHESENEKEAFLEGISLKEMQIIFYLTCGWPYWGECEWEKTNGFLWPHISCKI